MKRRDGLIAVLVCIVTSSAFLATLASGNSEGGFSFEERRRVMIFGFSAPMRTGQFTFGAPSGVSNRTQILGLVTGRPGVHFREICRALKMPVGLVQYHLGVLSGAGLVTSRRGRRYRRLFASGVFSEREMDVISALRNETAKQIVSMLLERPGMLHGELASELGVTSQAVTWQMGNLRALGIVEEENGSTNKHYIVSLDQLQMIQNCMNVL